MSDATAEFFGALGTQGDDRRLHNKTGVLRFDLMHNEQTEYWLVAVDKGDVSVSRPAAPVDCDLVVRTGKALFEGITRGERNATAAMLRGELSVDGNMELLWLFQRLLPAAPAAGDTSQESEDRSARR